MSTTGSEKTNLVDPFTCQQVNKGTTQKDNYWLPTLRVSGIHWGNIVRVLALWLASSGPLSRYAVEWFGEAAATIPERVRELLLGIVCGRSFVGVDNNQIS